MNFLILTALMLFGASCSNQELAENEELTTIEYLGRVNQEEEEPQEVFELDLQQFYVQGQLAKLDNQRKKQEMEIDAGNRDLIPEWESTIKQIDLNIEHFNSIQEIICFALAQRAKYLEDRIAKGDQRAKIELRDVQQKLKNCGNSASNYGEVVEIHLYIKAPPTKGGCKDPGPEFEGCKYPLVAGRLLVNVEERISQVVIKTDEGRIISEGELIDGNEQMPGFNQYSLDVPASIGKGLIAIFNDDKGYEVPIEVSKEF